MKKIPFKRSMAFLTLLLTSMLIATASAAVYYSMIMQPTVTITGAVIVFAQGDDWYACNGSTMGTNNTWVSLALKAYPNATLTYEEPLNVSNTDSADHSFRLRHVSITPANGNPDVGNFTFINFVVKNAAGNSQASFNYTRTGNNWNTPSTTSYMILPAYTQWIVYVETKAAAGATVDIAASIVIAVDVLE